MAPFGPLTFMVSPIFRLAKCFEMLPVGYDLISRSKWPGVLSELMGVYDRTTSFLSVFSVFGSLTSSVAAIEMCWPIGRPSMLLGEGSEKR